MFLAADAICRIVLNVVGGLVVNEGAIAAHVAAELPFIATESILMAAVKAGGDRQDLHERIRRHALAAREQITRDGKDNDLIDRLKADGALASVDFDAVLDPAGFVGRAPQQVDQFLAACVDGVRRKYADRLGASAQLEV